MIDGRHERHGQRVQVGEVQQPKTGARLWRNAIR